METENPLNQIETLAKTILLARNIFLKNKQNMGNDDPIMTNAIHQAIGETGIKDTSTQLISRLMSDQEVVFRAVTILSQNHKELAFKLT